MSRHLLLVLLVTSLSGRVTYAQEGPGPLADSAAAFQARRETVAWLLQYDRVAWVTSDSVMAEPEDVKKSLGSEWFCYRIANDWHAFYGAFDATADLYHIALHYTVDSAGHVASSTADVDTTRISAFARALQHANDALPAHFTDAGFPFNVYVRELGDSALEVWFLPGWHPRAHVMVYGGEASFVYDTTGRKERARHILLDEWRGFPLDRGKKISLDYESHLLPTVGSLFFLYSNRSNFKEIHIVTKAYVTTLVDSPDGPMLINALRSGKD